MDIKRREMMLGAGAIALGASARVEARQSAGSDVSDGEYFLSPRNPVATEDQRHLDAVAVELFHRPDIVKAKERAYGAFGLVTDKTVSKDVWGLLPAYIESYAFRSIQLAVNSDANYPRVYRVYSPAARFLGNDVPESRWGQENPDNIYRIIPIAHGGRYVVRGHRQANPPSDVSYTLVADTNTSITVALLGQRDLETDAGGCFEITLDETPANGRRNHIQVTRQAQYLFIRDSLGDWNQTPNALRVERLNRPTAAPATRDELAARAALVMQLGVAPAYYFNRLVLNGPGQTLTQPHGTGPSGGLLTQQSSHGWFKLGDGQAVIVRFDAVDAAYSSIVLYDMWGRSLEYRDHLTSLNGAQMQPDVDGDFTFVISHADPGVHNWLDTMAHREFCVGIRWQDISPGVKQPPRVEALVVNVSELDRELPRGIIGASPEQRAVQIRTRQQAYDRRFIES